MPAKRFAVGFAITEGVLSQVAVVVALLVADCVTKVQLAACAGSTASIYAGLKTKGLDVAVLG